MMGSKSKNFGFLIAFPIFWQTTTRSALAYALASTFVGWLYCATILSDMTASSIPEAVLNVPSSFLLASGIATLCWLIASVRHFRVGVLGYQVASPPLLLVFFVVGSLWCAPIFCFWYTSQAVSRLASVDDAGSGYVSMQRVATLLGGAAHFEPLKLQTQVQPPAGRDQLSKPVIEDIAKAALQPVQTFTPEFFRGALQTLIGQKLPECGNKLQLRSKADALAELDREFANLMAKSETPEKRQALRAERATKVDEANSDLDRSYERFLECLRQNVQDIFSGKEIIYSGLKAAQRNAYLVYVAHNAFGPNSADFRQYTADGVFAVPGLQPFGLGDLTVVATIIWIVLLISIVYVAFEYVDTSSFTSAAMGGFLAVWLLVLLASFFSSLSPLPPFSTYPSFFEMLASPLHWPALTVLPLALAALVGTALRPSRRWSRLSLLVTFLGLPFAIIVETLNGGITLISTSYANGNCPVYGWIGPNRLHCFVYSAWQPMYRDAGELLAGQLHWPMLWASAGFRYSLSAIVSVALALPAASILLLALKREFVRPRDQ